jgi:hypothetical protein
MSNIKKLMMSAAGGAGLNVEEIFSSYAYRGTGSNTSIVNDIDISTEGGAVLIKNINSTSVKPIMQDTENGASSHWESNSNSSYISAADCVTAFNSNGFSIGTNAKVNTGSARYRSYTFRKASKFFDVVQYTGNGSVRTISHNLGTAPGFIIFKSNAGYDSYIYHRSLGATKYMRWNETDGPQTQSAYFNNTEPTASVFTVGTANPINRNGDTITAYLFAHNNNDGGFGLDGDKDIIKCDEYTGNGSSTGPEIDLGFEPQFLIIKPQYGLGWQANIEDYIILDNISGIHISGTVDFWWNNNKTTASQQSGDRISLTPTGFKLDSNNAQFNYSGRKYIYIAIRRGPMAVPTNVRDVFDSNSANTSNLPNYSNSSASHNGFPVDMAINIYTSTGTSNRRLYDRNRYNQKLLTDATSGQQSGSGSESFEYMNGVHLVNSSNYHAHMWRRAPNYFDVVTYQSNNTFGQRIKHNLGVIPEMIWVKNISSSYDWAVFHKDLNGGTNAEDYYLRLNGNSGEANSIYVFGGYNSYYPTAVDFEVGRDYKTARGSDKYVAYLFATLDGISKVGSYTGDGTSDGSHAIDCGFSNGVRYVLFKRTDSTGDWWFFDTERGLTSGADTRMNLNTTAAQYNGINDINSTTTGFDFRSAGGSDLNVNNATYIFYAVAYPS